MTLCHSIRANATRAAIAYLIYTQDYYGMTPKYSSLSYLFPQSFITRELLLFVEESGGHHQPVWHGIVLAAGFFVFYATATVFISCGYIVNIRTGTRLRNGVLAMIFRKLLRLRNLQHKSVGEVSY